MFGFVILFLMIISLAFSYIFWRRGALFELSFSVAGNYFLILPGLFLILTGELPRPLDFKTTNIPNIVFDDHQGEVAAVFFSWVIINLLNLMHSNVGVSRARGRPSVTRKGLFMTVFILYELLAVGLFYLSGLGDRDGDSHWARTKEEFMREAGALGVLVVFVVSGLRYSFVALAINALLVKKSAYVAAIALAVCCATDLYVTGNRITTLVVAFSVAYILMRKKKYITISMLCIFALPFGWFMVMFRFIRSQLYSSDSLLDGFFEGFSLASELLEDGFGVFFEFVSGISESVNFNVLVGLYGRFGESVDYLNGSTYWKAAVWWLPRTLYESKPLGITVEAANIFAPNENVSLVVTAVGESYANFGFFSVFFLPAILFGFRCVVDLICVKSGYSDCIKLVYGFLLFRMAFSDLFVCMILGAVIVFVLNLRFKIGEKRPLGPNNFLGGLLAPNVSRG